MPLIINTNTLSLNAQRNLTHNTNMLAKTMEKLASGFRINRASDDAAGLQLSENLRAQIRGSKKALDNTTDGINVLNIADGSLQTIQDNLQRIRELAVQGANDTYSQPQRDAIVLEIEARLADNDRIGDSTSFNGIFLLNDLAPVAFAAGGPGFLLQVGPNGDPAGPPIDPNVIDIASALVDMTSDSGVAGSYGDAIDAFYAGAGTVVLTSNIDAQAILTQVDLAMTEVNMRRGNLGAAVNRLESATSNLLNSIENLSASESRIRNVDVAEESAALIKWQVLQQSAAAMLTQANQAPSIALQLLKG